MRALSHHYAKVRQAEPTAELCVVFDIDGTIFDMRHLVVHVLLSYDRAHGTDRFHGLVADDIQHHEEDVDALMDVLQVPDDEREEIADFYRAHLWDREALLAASRPFEGVFSVIRWFVLQPRTHVVLNTGRPQRLRADTLESLNTVGAAYRVRFRTDDLLMADPNIDVPTAKVRALEALRRGGKRVVAVIDNEPDNLRTMAAGDVDSDVLFLHADTIFASQRSRGDRVISGRAYRLGSLVPARSLPARVAFVWHGVNDRLNLERFLASDVRWAEVDVRHDPVGRLVLRHDGYDESPVAPRRTSAVCCGGGDHRCGIRTLREARPEGRQLDARGRYRVGPCGRTR